MKPALRGLLARLEKREGALPLPATRPAGGTPPPGVYAAPEGSPRVLCVVDDDVGTYRVEPVPGILDSGNSTLADRIGPGRAFVLVDSRVDEEYGREFRHYFDSHQIEHEVIKLV